MKQHKVWKSSIHNNPNTSAQKISVHEIIPKQEWTKEQTGTDVQMWSVTKQLLLLLKSLFEKRGRKWAVYVENMSHWLTDCHNSQCPYVRACSCWSLMWPAFTQTDWSLMVPEQKKRMLQFIYKNCKCTHNLSSYELLIIQHKPSDKDSLLMRMWDMKSMTSSLEI